MPPRIVSLLTLVQFLVILVGVLWTGSIMRLNDIRWMGKPLPDLPEWVRHEGFWLWLVPAGWAVGATLSARKFDEQPTVPLGWIVVGCLLLVVMVLMLGLSGLAATDMLNWHEGVIYR